MATVTDKGYIARTLPEILEELTNLFKSVYGADISVAPDTPDGQLIGILAQIFSDYEEIGAAVYKQLDPSSATGRWLDQRGALVGVYRSKGMSSTLPAVQIDAKPGTLVPNGYTVTDPSNVRWVISAPVTVGANGFTYVNFISEDTGSFNVAVGAELKPTVQITDITKVASTVATIPGNNKDSDPALRNKMLARKLTVNTNTCPKIMDALYKIPGVVTAIAYENPESTVNAMGMPANSIWPIIDGGSDTDIAKAILNTKSGGAKLRGAVTITIPDEYSIPRSISFDRFVSVALQASLTIVRSENVITVDSDLIKKALLDFNPGAGSDVYLSRVYSVINQVPGFWIKTLLIGKVDTTPVAANVVVGPQEFARFTTVDIVVE